MCSFILSSEKERHIVILFIVKFYVEEAGNRLFFYSNYENKRTSIASCLCELFSHQVSELFNFRHSKCGQTFNSCWCILQSRGSCCWSARFIRARAVRLFFWVIYRNEDRKQVEQTDTSARENDAETSCTGLFGARLSQFRRVYINVRELFFERFVLIINTLTTSFTNKLRANYEQIYERVREKNRTFLLFFYSKIFV